MTGFLLGTLVWVLLATAAVLAGFVQVGDQTVSEEAQASQEPTTGPGLEGDESGDVARETQTTVPEPPPARTFAETYEDVADGVVRLETMTCESTFTGSGALVAPDLVLTAAHVVDEHASVQLLLGAQSASGEVIGYSPENDTALIRASRPLEGHVFEFVEQPPGEGTEVVEIGYAEARALSMAGPGIISTYEESISLRFGEGLVSIEDVMRTTVPTNQGNSGGPVLDVAGRIVGLVSATPRTQGTLLPDGTIDISLIEGFMYAIPAQRAEELVGRWSMDPEPLAPAVCENRVEPGAGPLVVSQEVSTDADAVVEVLLDYFEGINQSDYQRAYEQLSPERRAGESLDHFAEQFSTSVVSNAVVLGTRRPGESPDSLVALVTFTSRQSEADGPEGLSCVYWTLEYRFVPDGSGGWYIDTTRDVEGQPRFEACTGE